MLAFPTRISLNPDSARSIWVKRPNPRYPVQNVQRTMDALAACNGQYGKVTVAVSGRAFSALYPPHVDRIGVLDTLSKITDSTRRLEQDADVWLCPDSTCLVYRGEGPMDSIEEYLKAHIEGRVMTTNDDVRYLDTLTATYLDDLTGRWVVNPVQVRTVPESNTMLIVSPVHSPELRIELPIWCFIQPTDTQE